jgi:hypothetical protein
MPGNHRTECRTTQDKDWNNTVFNPLPEIDIVNEYVIGEKN